jgi:hypothetical protein
MESFQPPDKFLMRADRLNFQAVDKFLRRADKLIRQQLPPMGENG